jgi:hypothetical protein
MGREFDIRRERCARSDEDAERTQRAKWGWKKSMRRVWRVFTLAKLDRGMESISTIEDEDADEDQLLRTEQNSPHQRLDRFAYEATRRSDYPRPLTFYKSIMDDNILTPTYLTSYEPPQYIQAIGGSGGIPQHADYMSHPPHTCQLSPTIRVVGTLGSRA